MVLHQHGRLTAGEVCAGGNANTLFFFVEPDQGHVRVVLGHLHDVDQDGHLDVRELEALAAALGCKGKVLQYLHRVNLHASHLLEALHALAGLALLRYSGILRYKGLHGCFFHSWLLLLSEVCFIKVDIHYFRY